MDFQVDVVLLEYFTQEFQRTGWLLHDFFKPLTDHNNEHFSFNVHELVHRDIQIRCRSQIPLSRINGRRFAL